MRPIVGIRVQDLLKSSEVGPAKLAVYRGYRAFEDEPSNWAADQVIKRIRGSVPELSLSDNPLPAYTMLTNVSNDPEDSLFAPEDQFPLVYETLKRAHAFLFVAKERCGFPDSNTVRFIERLGDLAHEQHRVEAVGQHKPLLENRPAAIIVVGGCQASTAAMTLSVALNKLGLTIARKGIVSWNNKKDDAMKSEDFFGCLTQMADNLVELVKTFR